MATKIYCAAMDCEFYRDDGRCTAKTVCLSDHSVMTVWDGRQRFQRCKTWQKSQRAAELEEKVKPLIEKMKESQPGKRMERKYFAISIKHTEHKWKFGEPCVLWGYKRTSDDEKRCFAGYTENPSKAELYAEDDFIKHGYGIDVIKPTPVEMTVNLCKKWCMYDTVLIEADQYIGYCKMACIPTGSEQEA